MFGIDAPTAMLVLVMALMLTVMLSMRRTSSGDDARFRRARDPKAMLLGVAIIAFAFLGGLWMLGVFQG